jgi:site-specific recombinase XerD
LFVVLSSPVAAQKKLTAAEAKDHVGETATVCGSVVSTRYATGTKGQPTFLNLDKPYPNQANGRNGALLVTRGKTAAARRVIPMTPRVRKVLESSWNEAGKQQEGWVWPAPTRSGHVEPSSLRKQHARTFKTLDEEAAKRKQKPFRRFVLYSLRHTFLTRLGQSGCDVWTLARIAGHSSIAVSSRYVHPSEDAVLTAMSRLGGHKTGHNENVLQTASEQRRLTQ